MCVITKEGKSLTTHFLRFRDQPSHHEINKFQQKTMRLGCQIDHSKNTEFLGIFANDILQGQAVRISNATAGTRPSIVNTKPIKTNAASLDTTTVTLGSHQNAPKAEKML